MFCRKSLQRFSDLTIKFSTFLRYPQLTETGASGKRGKIARSRAAPASDRDHVSATTRRPSSADAPVPDRPPNARSATSRRAPSTGCGARGALGNRARPLAASRRSSERASAQRPPAAGCPASARRPPRGSARSRHVPSTATGPSGPRGASAAPRAAAGCAAGAGRARIRSRPTAVSHARDRASSSTIATTIPAPVSRVVIYENYRSI